MSHSWRKPTFQTSLNQMCYSWYFDLSICRFKLRISITIWKWTSSSVIAVTSPADAIAEFTRWKHAASGSIVFPSVCIVIAKLPLLIRICGVAGAHPQGLERRIHFQTGGRLEVLCNEVVCLQGRGAGGPWAHAANAVWSPTKHVALLFYRQSLIVYDMPFFSFSCISLTWGLFADSKEFWVGSNTYTCCWARITPYLLCLVAFSSLEIED